MEHEITTAAKVHVRKKSKGFFIQGFIPYSQLKQDDFPFNDALCAVDIRFNKNHTKDRTLEYQGKSDEVIKLEGLK